MQHARTAPNEEAYCKSTAMIQGAGSHRVQRGAHRSFTRLSMAACCCMRSAAMRAFCTMPLVASPIIPPLPLSAFAASV